ncbi:putative 1-phosphatidylinositol-4,5-bisphosphate phosphodiesterase 1 [Podospora appendiculata]|uniref:Phosphoinositide phospholipase C n=1 Tax=Podospora appendiculata TaxID=314037 RepID=A0AAE1CG69_9PEZI|nr:putative 1-phosphatidylinositol-4,5-bisphosphate phosphodiesterase 1 [Podospora appendiculata]
MADSITPSGLAARLARKLTFKRTKPAPEDDDDKGEEVDPTSVAGGGHSARRTDITEHQLRVSGALQAFLASERIVYQGDTTELHKLLSASHIVVPPHVTDRSHPLPEYFISSSHNTYLLAHQLFGVSSASAYENALKAGARCVEIDAWDNPDDPAEPKVTHGYTLVSNISFRAVCETIRDVVDREAGVESCDQGYTAAPILLSLENHCGAAGQQRLVDIMQEVWGPRLLDAAVREDNDAHATLAELGSKIVLIVEYHLPDTPSPPSSSSSSSSSSSDGEEETLARQDYKAKLSSLPPTTIIPALASLGIYAQSVKPADDSWYNPGPTLTNGPHHHLINVSEAGLTAHMVASSSATGQSTAAIARHNAHHLMRVFPKGTRISSRNLSPLPFWAIGAQICALNWQTFGASMQLNEALFAGTAGYVLKPAALRTGGDGVVVDEKRKKVLRLRVVGVTDLPLPPGREADAEVKPYVTCSLLRPGRDGRLVVDKRKTGVYRQHKVLSFLHAGEDKNPPVTDPVWDETLEWEFDDSELVFLRIMVKSDDSFAANPVFAVAAVRLLYVVGGWRFIRLLDLKGRETTCSLLVSFEIADAIPGLLGKVAGALLDSR